MASINIRPELFPVKDGYINLKTGDFTELLGMHPNYVEWRGIDYPTDYIETYIGTLVVKEFVSYFQILLGYLLTNDRSGPTVLLFVGNGKNGKSLLCNILKRVAYKSYRNIHVNYITGATLDIPTIMHDNKLLFCNNVEKKSEFNITSINDLTVTSKIIIECQDIPTMAYDKNVQIIRFINTFEDNDAIQEALLSRLDEFLVWLVKGSITYYQNGKMNQIPSPIIKKSTTCIIL